MIKKIVNRKRKLLRRIYGALSFTTALFIFQACYGSPYDPHYLGTWINGNVISGDTKLPVEGIKITPDNQYWDVVFTESDGSFHIPVSFNSIYNLKFEDIDSVQNGQYLPLDTNVTVKNSSVFLNIQLNAR